MKKGLLFLGIMLFLILAIADPEIALAETEPNDRMYFDFDTYEELGEWFVADDIEDAGAMEEAAVWRDEYQTFINDIIQGKNKILTPYFGETPIPLRKRDGFSNITIMTKEAYGRPWIWYHCISGDVEYRICLMYLSDEEIEYSKGKQMDEVLTFIAPKTPQVGDWLNVLNYKTYELETMHLNDRDVSVLNKEYYDDSRLYKTFVYDNVLVNVVGSEEVFDETLWRSFRLIDMNNPPEYVPREAPQDIPQQTSQEEGEEDNNEMTYIKYVLLIVLLIVAVGIIVFIVRISLKKCKL
ncbi:MAG: hypothetical protein IJ419_02985 [Agathobacter sp.]|nr:hypothetical protein [Agathobacter sp.]